MVKNRRAHYFGGDEKARIEIIPMIDVMMFLLVFFVLIMTEMIQGSGVQLDLPQAQTTQALRPTRITLGVAKDGSVHLDGQVVTQQQVAERLAAEQASGKVDVVIAGDQAVPYQKIMQTMDWVRAAGITSIGLAAQKP